MRGREGPYGAEILETLLRVQVGNFTSRSWKVSPNLLEWSAVDTAVLNQVQVLPLNGLLWPSGYLFLRIGSIWYYDGLLLFILIPV